MNVPISRIVFLRSAAVHFLQSWNHDLPICWFQDGTSWERATNWDNITKQNMYFIYEIQIPIGDKALAHRLYVVNQFPSAVSLHILFLSRLRHLSNFPIRIFHSIWNIQYYVWFYNVPSVVISECTAIYPLSIPCIVYTRRSSDGWWIKNQRMMKMMKKRPHCAPSDE